MVQGSAYTAKKVVGANSCVYCGFFPAKRIAAYAHRPWVINSPFDECETCKTMQAVDAYNECEDCCNEKQEMEVRKMHVCSSCMNTYRLKSICKRCLSLTSEYADSENCTCLTCTYSRDFMLNGFKKATCRVCFTTATLSNEGICEVCHIKHEMQGQGDIRKVYHCKVCLTPTLNSRLVCEKHTGQAARKFKCRGCGSDTPTSNSFCANCNNNISVSRCVSCENLSNTLNDRGLCTSCEATG